MAERESIRHDKAADKATAILQELLRSYPGRDFAVELWDGRRFDPAAGNVCRFTWHIKKLGAMRALFGSKRELRLGEAYVWATSISAVTFLRCSRWRTTWRGQHTTFVRESWTCTKRSC
jgi:hypothetical protein